MISYDSNVGQQIVSNVKDSGETLKTEIANKISNDYSALLDVGLFSSQIQSIISAVNELVDSYDSFTSIIEENKSSWIRVQEESVKDATEFSNEVYEIRRTPRNSGAVQTGSIDTAATKDVVVEDVSKGKEISLNEVKQLIVSLDSSLVPVLIQKLGSLAGDEALIDLLTDKNKSDELAVLLKKILGDTTNNSVELSSDTEAIQKEILKKLGIENIDLTTEDGVSLVKKEILSQLNKKSSNINWNRILYGDNTISINLQGEEWTVAKTNTNLNSYLEHINNNKVKQSANLEEWDGSSLAFSEAYAYDLFYNTKTNGIDAVIHNRANSLVDYLSNSKEDILSRIYDEIMSGKPVVLQVNGNTEGTSPYYVTIVGFKNGVVSGATLKETDLLILDSADGQIERMDTAKSKFMTTGTQCNQSYKGYRIRVIKKEKSEG